VKYPLVQILVTVAITQMKLLRIEVEKGFRRTLFEPELVGPNVQINFVNGSRWASKWFVSMRLQYSVSAWVYL